MEIEILGSGGASTTPRPFCSCMICEEARDRGVPYSRLGPAYFIHDANILIDTPEEIGVMINRSRIQRVDAVIYSHWPPDHTRGLRIWENNALRWEYPYRTVPTDVYLPQQVAEDFKERIGLWESIEYMSQRGYINPVIVPDNTAFEINGITIKPFRVAEDYVYAFLFAMDGKNVLIAPDELFGWTPPEWLPPLDLAIVPAGLIDFHPLSGERLIPEEHPVLQHEATFADTLKMIQQMTAKQVILGHLDETNQLSYDDCLALEKQLNAGNITFAFDQQIISV